MAERLADGDLSELRALMDSAASLALISTDPEGRITGASRGAEIMLGYERDELLGETPLLFHDPGEVSARSSALGAELGRPISGFEVFVARLSSERPDEGEWTWIRKDGTRLVVSLTANELRDPSGRLSGYLGLALDITRRKKAEAALEREREFTERLVNGLPGIFYLYDAELRLRRWNRNHETLLGFKPEEMEGRFLGDWHPPGSGREAAISASRDIVERGIALDAVEAPLLHKDGRCIPFLLTGVRIESPSGPMLAGVGIDLTERRKLEEQLRQVQKMESVGRLAGGVAHDFNNILTSIMGNLDLAEVALDPGSRIHSYLDSALRAAESAAMLTRQLLAFSRKEMVRPRIVDMNRVLSGMNGMLSRLLGEDVELRLAEAPALWPVNIDPGQLDQIVMNLAVNARDAMPQGGRLTLETANVALDEAYARDHPTASPGEYSCLSVSDTGVGMDAEVQSHLFEPFFTTKELGRGTGLGLATVFGALKQNHGHIEVESAPGRGSTFRIYLPRAQGEAEPLELPIGRDRPAGGRETVILAEDDEAIRKVATEALGTLGYRVLACPDGAAALDASLAAGTVDILVTDIVMPDMNGRELAKRMGGRMPRLKVLFTSGYPADMAGSLEAPYPGTDFLPKPYGPMELARRVRALLDAAAT